MDNALISASVLSNKMPVLGGYMSKTCAFCGKTPQVGNLVSHSNIKTKRRFSPNLQRVRHQAPDGSVRTLTVCTRCLRSGLVRKPAVRKAR